MSLKVLIPTGGKGIDLGDITKYLNKSLVKIGKKPALSYIIESYPSDTEFIITTGYYSEQVKDFIKLVYPEKKIEIVEVDLYDGEGSSFLYSISKAKSFLQQDFIYHACDTVILDTIHFFDSNWIGGYKGLGSSNYAGFNSNGKFVDTIFDKGIIQPDFIHIGIVYIKDYEIFWKLLDTTLNKSENENTNKNDIGIINGLISQGSNFKIQEFKNWFDTGNIEGLAKARKEIIDSFHILDKLEESIYIYDDFVVKFFYEQALSDKRVQRASYLAGLVPRIQGHEKNFFRYEFSQGKLYSRSANPKNFKDFFYWSKNNLWQESVEVSEETFKNVCYDFYYTKSITRINKFLSSHDLKDETHTINGEKIPSIKELFEKIDFDSLCTSKQTLFHGDFILDNIIQTKDGFCLLDWRQDFGGLLQSGDMYYDLAKLNHNLTVNHDIVNSDLYSIEKEGDHIRVDIHRREILVQCQNIYHTLIIENGYDLKKVQILTAIIWLNMSPLHHHPFDKFLFYFGKYNLWKAIHI